MIYIVHCYKEAARLYCYIEAPRLHGYMAIVNQQGSMAILRPQGYLATVRPPSYMATVRPQLLPQVVASRRPHRREERQEGARGRERAVWSRDSWCRALPVPPNSCLNR